MRYRPKKPDCVRWTAPSLEVDWQALGALFLSAPLLAISVLGKRLGCCRLHVWLALQGRRYDSARNFVEAQRPMVSEWRDPAKRKRFEALKETMERGAFAPLQRAMALTWLGLFAVIFGIRAFWQLALGGVA